MGTFFTYVATSRIGQWLAGKMMGLVLIIALIVLVYGGYYYIDSKARVSEQNKIALEQQAQEITALKKSLETLEKSNKLTADTVASLAQDQQVIDTQSTARNDDVKKRLKAIAQSNAPSDVKAINVSRVYIESLRKNYCNTKPEKCVKETEK